MSFITMYCRLWQHIVGAVELSASSDLNNNLRYSYGIKLCMRPYFAGQTSACKPAQGKIRSAPSDRQLESSVADKTLGTSEE
jgi:hypothetical protein